MAIPTARAFATGLLAALLVSGCGASKESAAPRTFDETAFRAENFVDPTTGSNQWFPLTPGMQWVKEGTTLIGNRRVPQSVVTTVTDVIREVDGVKTILVYDHSEGAGQVVQESLDYFAQDKSNNVDSRFRPRERCVPARRSSRR